MHFKTISSLAPLIESGKLSPVEITRAQLDRIEQLDGTLHAYATVTADLALDQASQAEREITNGAYRGKLHGIPIAVKDLCNTNGIRTMGGSAVFADNIPDNDATVRDQPVRRRRVDLLHAAATSNRSLQNCARCALAHREQ